MKVGIDMAGTPRQLAQAMHQATEGIIALVAKLLQKADDKRRQHHHAKLTPWHLAQAYDDLRGPGTLGASANPFARLIPANLP